MYHKMMDEAAGLPLPQRFVLYNHFLTLLQEILVRSPNFDMKTLELLKTRILELREKRGIAPPSPTEPTGGTLIVRDAMAMVPVYRERNVHWAEDIFTQPLPCRTPLDDVEISKSFGPWSPLSVPPSSKILFRQRFDDDRLSVMVILNAVDDSPYMIVRTLHNGQQYFSSLGVHQLVITREGSSLELSRWSDSKRRVVPWAVLFFSTLEELVLFHCTFVALKFRSHLVHKIDPREYQIGDEKSSDGEKRLFQARIIDDGFDHSLIVYKDHETGALRLHAAVWGGELKRCPVWTAFIVQKPKAPMWLTRKNRNRVWLTDVQLYVFCNPYRQENMRQNRAGAFELYFVNETAANRFMDVFYPPATPSSSTNEGAQ
jgi:hypothetical protein